MSTINSSTCSDSAASTQEEMQPEALRVNFDRIDPKLEKFFRGESTIRHLNRHVMALQGLNAINRLLLGNAIAQDCMEPSLNGHTVGGLLAAAIALSDMAVDEIEDWAAWADRKARQDTEASQG
ncbi:hypothetical protein BGLA2_190030 [Burkholderia gladioli]|uniref:hypothetical protein n=1 Tax=Burkholderia gladioli TaxID=28095 RepID=UPI001CB533F3|nr:hypothetical protein [Burkholderia gladioli]CAG9208469.1 hypothetical protein BGLA2_190030 [Burkholderia gladioli]